MTERVIRVTLDSRGVTQGARKVDRSLKGIERQQVRVAKGFSAIRVAAAGAAAVFAGNQILQTADLYNTLQNRLKLVTDGTQNLADITEELFAVSQRSRGSFEGTVELFSRVARSTEQLGVSQQQVIQFTENVSQAVRVSGATAQESSAAIIQLGQGLASGELRGEELRSVLEQLPSLAREIATGLGVPFGKLRELAADGKLTTEAVFQAVLSRTEEINAEAGKLDTTLGQAFTTLSNSSLAFVGSLDQTLGVTKALSDLVVGLAQDFDNLGQALDGTLEPTQELSEGFGRLAVGVIVVGEAFGQFFNLLTLGKDAIADTVTGIVGINAAFIELATGNVEEAAAIINDVFSGNTFRDTAEEARDFQTSLSDGIENVSNKITEVLLPAFRETNEAQSTITNSAKELSTALDDSAEAAAKAAEKQAAFLADLLQQEEALSIAAETGRDYAEVLEELEVAALAAGNAAFQFDALDAIREIRRLNEEIETRIELEEKLADEREGREDTLEELRLENEALQAATASGLEFAEALARINLERQAGGDDEFLQEALDLTEANEKLRDQLEESEETVDDFVRRARENSQDVLAGFLADPLEDGLDELPGKFAQVLQDIAAQALASKIFDVLGGLFAGAAGPAGGGVLGFLGNFFGGAANGASLQGGDFGVVGERGPELFVAPGAGNVVPNEMAFAPPQVTVAPQIINVQDPAEIPAAMQSSAGEEVILNTIKNNPDIVRQISA